jgi:hypothetical protein
VATGGLEGLNGILLIERQMTILELLDALWTRCHEQRVLRAEEARKWMDKTTRDYRQWTPYAEGLIKARDRAAKQQQVVAIVSKYIDAVSNYYLSLSNTNYL